MNNEDNVYIEYSMGETPQCDDECNECNEYNRNFVLDEYAFMDENDMTEKQALYEKSSVATIKIISDFYGLPKNRRKRELINRIIEYENDVKNEDHVKNKMRYWYYINELKQHPIFSKYINILL
jgi:hypothetical protein